MEIPILKLPDFQALPSMKYARSLADRPYGLGFILMVLLWWTFNLIAGAQTLPPRINSFPPDRYEGHHQVFSTETIPSDRQAFGTGGEVLVRDGEGFGRVDVGDGKYALSLGRDSAGRLFVGGSSLMGMIVPDSSGSSTFRSLQPLLPDSLKGFGNIWDTYQDGNGGVYFNNTFNKLFYYKGDTIEVIRPETRFLYMHRVSGRPVIEDTDSGLFELSGGRKRYLSNSEVLAKGKGVKAILPAAKKDSGVWTVFTETHGIHHYTPSTGNVRRIGGEEAESAGSELSKAKVHTAVRLDPGANPYQAAYAVGTRLNGLYLLDANGRIRIHLGSEDGLPADLVWQVKKDAAGHLWAATNNGIAHIKTGLPFMLTEESELFRGSIRDLARGSSFGEEASRSPLMLAGSQGAWVWSEKDEDFYLIEGTEGQCNELFPHSPENGRPRILIAGDGLFSAPSVPPEDGPSFPLDTVSNDHAYSLSGRSSSQGSALLMGGRDGLQVLVPSERGAKKWEKCYSLKELPEEVQSVGWGRKDPDSDSIRLWAAMPSQGVLSVTLDSAFEEGHVLRHDTGDGLPEGAVQVFSQASLNGKKPLFGTDLGLFAFDEGRFAPTCQYGRIFCDSSRQVFRLEKGRDGELWINDWRGGHIKHLVPGEEGFRFDSTIFRALDLGGIRALHHEKERVWIGGSNGLASYHPGMDTDTKLSWDCRLSKVLGKGDSLLFGGQFFEERPKGKEGLDSLKLDRFPVKEQPERMVPVMPYSKNRMEFLFAAAFPTQQSRVRYSYKLSGFDSSWSEWSKETRKEYTNLPEGAYTFRVKARNVYLEESSTATYRFTVLPPWYRTWTAYGGYTLAGVGLIWLLLWLNSRRLRAQKERLERIVDERTKEIQDKNLALEDEKKAVQEQKENVELEQKETEKQKEKVEEAHQELQTAHDKLNEAHQEIRSSIAYARKIQNALLGSEEHVSPHVPEHFILFKPQSQVSGDFYWAREHKDHFYIAAVDCTGHGVPGAFMSMLGISQLNEVMNTDELLTPGRILNELRERVVRELSGSDPESTAKDGMDVTILRIANSDSNPHSDSEGEELEVQFAGAQNPLYVIRKGIVEEPPSASMEYQGEKIEGYPANPFRKSKDGIEIKGDGQPVGQDEYAKDRFTTVQLHLRKGDMLYFFSDGYADQFGGPKGKKFRYRPFKQLLVKLHEKPLEDQKQELDRTFEDWKAESEQEQIDDVVVIGVRL